MTSVLGEFCCTFPQPSASQTAAAIYKGTSWIRHLFAQSIFVQPSNLSRNFVHPKMASKVSNNCIQTYPNIGLWLDINVYQWPMIYVFFPCVLARVLFLVHKEEPSPQMQRHLQQIMIFHDHPAIHHGHGQYFNVFSGDFPVSHFFFITKRAFRKQKCKFIHVQNNGWWVDEWFFWGAILPGLLRISPIMGI